jgi:SOS response regulatory protein OraA/RecX
MIKKSWWVDLRVNYTRYRKRSPENSRTGAQAYEATLRQKLARGESIDRVANEEKREQTFEQFARKWFEEYVVPNNKYSEQRTKRYLLNAFLIPFFGKMLIAQITARDIERYKAHEIKNGAISKTLKNRLTVLRLHVARLPVELPNVGGRARRWPRLSV